MARPKRGESKEVSGSVEEKTLQACRTSSIYFLKACSEYGRGRFGVVTWDRHFFQPSNAGGFQVDADLLLYASLFEILICFPHLRTQALILSSSLFDPPLRQTGAARRSKEADESPLAAIMTRRLREDPRYDEEEKMEAVVQASIWSQNVDPQLHAAIQDSLKTEQPAGYDDEAELQREL